MGSAPRHWSLLLPALLAAAPAMAAEEFKAPPPPPNLAALGANIQRTMTLLATSTPQKRNRVRILFYGQSVTAGPWSYALADDLRKAFPNADLQIENRAIGGYEAPALIHTAEYDLYPFYPDLLIFHVYGGVETGEQEEIIKRVRQRTASEVLLWTSHFRWPKDLPRDGSPDDPQAKRSTDQDEKRAAKLRDIAPKYGCELAEVREQFRQYLKENSLFPKDTLADSVHPNKLGGFLIQSLVRPYLRYDAKFPQEPWKELVRDIAAEGPEVKRGPDGSLEVSFEGNRIEAIAAHTGDPRLGTARVLLDGKPPSEYPELYYHGHPTAAPLVWWPSINRIDHEKPLQLEKWTVKIVECDPEKSVLRFEVSGSKTGQDGAGAHSRRLVYPTGRVVIDPRYWSVIGALRYKKQPLPANYEITWEVKPLFVDTYQAPKTEDPAKEYAVTLAQGMANGRHTLRLVPNGDGAVPIAAFRVSRPPLK